MPQVPCREQPDFPHRVGTGPTARQPAHEAGLGEQRARRGRNETSGQACGVQMCCEILKPVSPSIRGTGPGMRSLSPVLVTALPITQSQTEGLRPLRTISGRWLFFHAESRQSHTLKVPGPRSGMEMSTGPLRLSSSGSLGRQKHALLAAPSQAAPSRLSCSCMSQRFGVRFFKKDTCNSEGVAGNWRIKMNSL